MDSLLVSMTFFFKSLPIFEVQLIFPIFLFEKIRGSEMSWTFEQEGV